MIDIVNYSTLQGLEDAIYAKRPQSSDNGYQIWKKYHEDLCAVARRFGKLNDLPNQNEDYYTSGDWFHELADAFALETTRAVNPEALHAFQRVVATHHPSATLNLDGDLTTPLFGLNILVTPAAILVAWDEQPASICRNYLVELGISIEAQQTL
jgi:hypothetical protein